MQRTGSSLAIDPEAQICDLSAEVLADAGYIVQVVQDGEGTLATMTRHRPALIPINPRRPDQLGRRTRTVERMSTSYWAWPERCKPEDTYKCLSENLGEGFGEGCALAKIPPPTYFSDRH